MKIYNKKPFAEGMFMLALGSIILIMDLINHTFGINGVVLTIALYVLGGGLVIRSLSIKFSKEDRLETMDERNQLIELQAKSKALRLTQAISFLLLLVFLVVGKLSTCDGFIAMGIGLAFSFSVSMFTEIFTYVYYESKN